MSVDHRPYLLEHEKNVDVFKDVMDKGKAGYRCDVQGAQGIHAGCDPNGGEEHSVATKFGKKSVVKGDDDKVHREDQEPGVWEKLCAIDGEEDRLARRLTNGIFGANAETANHSTEDEEFLGMGVAGYF